MLFKLLPLHLSFGAIDFFSPLNHSCMKFRLLVLAMLVMSSFCASAKLDTNQIMKRWKISKHTKKGKPVKYHANDYIQFDSLTHSFEQVALDIYVKGRWDINSKANSITIQSGKVIFEWTVTELTDKVLKATKDNEILELEAIPLPVCLGDPYANESLICGKWKIVDHKMSGLAVRYQPTDFIRFMPGGTCEKVNLGVYSKLTWKYDEENHKLIVSDGSFVLNELTEKKIKAVRSEKKEVIVMLKIRG